MEVNEDGYCFVCGTENPIGLKANFSTNRDTKSASCTLTLSRNFQGWENVVHGGMLSSLLDEAAIYACRTCGESFVTAEMKVNFRKPVQVLEPMTVSATVVREKRKVYEVESQVVQGGEICAQATIKAFRLA